jgi:hypothetical protein
MKLFHLLMRCIQFADFTDGLDELIESPCANASEMGLPLRESHLDGVEIGAIGRQEQNQLPWD